MMNAQEKYEYWLVIAQYDLDTANAMLSSRRWLYVVFMCQQAVEKLVKGLYTLYVSDDVPKTHNITHLFRELEDKLPESAADEYYDFFDDLHAFYINGRYTNFKKKLSVSVDEKRAKNVFEKTKEVFAWLLTLKA
jgi:HEPN domain-containing protein